MATEVVQFYFCHCGTTAALPADDLAEKKLIIVFEVIDTHIHTLFIGTVFKFLGHCSIYSRFYTNHFIDYYYFIFVYQNQENQ